MTFRSSVLTLMCTPSSTLLMRLHSVRRTLTTLWKLNGSKIDVGSVCSCFDLVSIREIRLKMCNELASTSSAFSNDAARFASS